MMMKFERGQRVIVAEGATCGSSSYPVEIGMSGPATVVGPTLDGDGDIRVLIDSYSISAIVNARFVTPMPPLPAADATEDAKVALAFEQVEKVAYSVGVDSTDLAEALTKAGVTVEPDPITDDMVRAAITAMGVGGLAHSEMRAALRAALKVRAGSEVRR